MSNEPADIIINNISGYINNAIDNINNTLLFNNKYKMIIIYSDKCEYCQEYLDEIDKRKDINIDIIKLNVDYPMDNKIWSKAHGVARLPCTLFMDKDNKIRGKVDGRIPMDKILMDINKIFEGITK